MGKRLELLLLILFLFVLGEDAQAEPLHPESGIYSGCVCGGGGEKECVISILPHKYSMQKFKGGTKPVAVPKGFT